MTISPEQEIKRLRWMVQHYHEALKQLVTWVSPRTPVQEEDEPLWWARGMLNTWRPDQPFGIDWQARAQRAEQSIVDAYSCLMPAADAAEAQMGNFPAAQFKRALVTLRKAINSTQEDAPATVEHDGDVKQLDKVKQALLQLDRMGFPCPIKDRLMVRGENGAARMETVEEATERRDKMRWEKARSLLREVIVQDGAGTGWPEHMEGDEHDIL